MAVQVASQREPLYNRAVTDKDLEVLLSVIHLKLESVLSQVSSLNGFGSGTREPEVEMARYLLRRLAWELQGLASDCGYADLLSLLGDIKQMEAQRALRSAFLQAKFGYLYRFVPSWCQPYYGRS